MKDSMSNFSDEHSNLLIMEKYAADSLCLKSMNFPSPTYIFYSGWFVLITLYVE